MFALALLALGAFSNGASAQTAQQFELCMNADNRYSRDQQIGGCTAVIQSSRRSGKDLVWGLHNRAYAYYRNDNYEAAIGDFTEVLRINPADAHALNGRCWMRAIIGVELARALEDCNESLRLRANDAPTLDSRGLTCLKLGQLNHAISDYDAALAIDPTQAESYFGRGVAKLKKGDTAGGNADIAAAKRIQADVAQEFSKYGVRLGDGVATIAPPGTTVDCARAVAQRGGGNGLNAATVRDDPGTPSAIVVGAMRPRIRSASSL